MQLQTTSPESKFPNEYSDVIFIQIDQHLNKLLQKYKGVGPDFMKHGVYMRACILVYLWYIYRPRRDGRLSRPWCEVAQAEIRTCNLPIANPALYRTATSAP